MLNRHLPVIFLLGVSSGVPFLLVLSTLSVWLVEVGISKTQIGLFAWVTLPYSLKFLGAPWVDVLRIPILSKKIGQRRSWLLLSQIGLVLSIVGLSQSNPSINILTTVWFASLVGLFSALQDIVFEAYRAEVVPKKHLGVAASASVLGYRFGMLCSGAGALYIAAFSGSWQIAYALISLTIVVGIFATLVAKEPQVVIDCSGLENQKKWLHALNQLFLQQQWWVIVLFVLSFKVADTVLNIMTMPFLLEIGFSKLEIAHIAKTFGLSAMICGGFIGGILLTRQSLRQYLTLCALFQCFACVLFVVQSIMGHQLGFLFVTMGVENLTCGMSQVAIVAYLSSLCCKPYTAMHYALLSSFASFVRVQFSSCAGFLADQVSWTQFYIIVSLTCIPSIVILYIFAKHFGSSDNNLVDEFAVSN